MEFAATMKRSGEKFEPDDDVHSSDPSVSNIDLHSSLSVRPIDVYEACFPGDCCSRCAMLSGTFEYVEAYFDEMTLSF